MLFFLNSPHILLFQNIWTKHREINWFIADRNVASGLIHYSAPPPSCWQKNVKPGSEPQLFAMRHVGITVGHRAAHGHRLTAMTLLHIEFTL